MADIELVIKISEDVYTRLFDNGRPTDIADGIVIDRAIRKGIPLPKGHGRLIDVDNVFTYSENLYEAIDLAPTIIEADDKESRE